MYNWFTSCVSFCCIVKQIIHTWEVKALVVHSCLTLWDPVDCSLPGSSVHRILQARILDGLSCPPPGDLPTWGFESVSLRFSVLHADSLPSELTGKPLFKIFSHIGHYWVEVPVLSVGPCYIFCMMCTCLYLTSQYNKLVNTLKGKEAHTITLLFFFFLPFTPES